MNLILEDKYYGATASNEEMERLVNQKNISRFLVNEDSLFKTKWFDYRNLHPFKATCLYYRLWLNVEKDFMKRYIDHVAAEELSKKEIIEQKQSVLKSIISGRQYADELGIPYGYFIFYTFDFLLEETNWQRIPSYNQVYNKGMSSYLLKRWEDYNLDCWLQLAISQEYSRDNFNNTDNQRDYQKYLDKHWKS